MGSNPSTFGIRERPQTLAHCIVGLTAGVLVSVLPFPLSLLLIVSIGALMVRSFLRSTSPSTRKGRVVEMLVGSVVLVVAVLLPLKHLDRKVGPMSYENASLEDLTRKLSRDWGIYALVDDPWSTNVQLSFSTDRSLTRREVLEKLARDSQLTLRIGYSGTAATLLFGADPSYTRLIPPPENPPASAPLGAGGSR